MLGHEGPVGCGVGGGVPEVGCWPVGVVWLPLAVGVFLTGPSPLGVGCAHSQPGCLHCSMGWLLHVGVPLLASRSGHYLVSLICDFSGTFVHLLGVGGGTVLFWVFYCYLSKIIIIIILFIHFYVNTRTVLFFM